MSTEDLRYPIGKYTPPETITEADIETWIGQIEKLPAELAAAVAGLTEEQLQTPYRPGGWTVQQLVHHVADSHLNSLVRFKWTLTEDNPTIKAYDQVAWALLSDYADIPVSNSLSFLALLHERWITLLKALEPEHLARTFVHPETNRELRLDWLVGLYAWHGRHHTAHIAGLRERNAW